MSETFFIHQQTDLPVVIIRASDRASIPADPANTDYVAYLEWVSAGNTPEPWQPDQPQEVV